MGRKGSAIVATSFDDNYLFPFLLLAYSISKNSAIAPQIYCANVNNTLSHENQKTAKAFCALLGLELKVYEATIPQNVQTDSRISVAAYGRLWLADNLSEDFVYIDTDSLVLPGWEKIFEFLTLLDDDRSLLFAAIPDDQISPQFLPVIPGNVAVLSFHSCVLVINKRNWSEHFSIQDNRPWQLIALMHDTLNFKQHDQSVLSYVAQGKFLHLPLDFVNFATKYTYSQKIVTSGVWKPKPWTVRRDQYLKYISSISMHRTYEQVIETIKELDIYNQFEDEMLESLNSVLDLKHEILRIKKLSQKSLIWRKNMPFIISKSLFKFISYPRKLLSILLK